MDRLSKKQIIELLPHREPMLLIDELINIKITLSYCCNECKKMVYVQGHFLANL